MRANREERESLVIAGLIFTVALIIFLASPISQVTDSKYSMLVSYSVLKKGSFALDDYGLPRLAPRNMGNYLANGRIYQLEVINSHLFYHLPPGSSILSIPFVAVLDLVGVSPVNPDGTYNLAGDILIQRGIAGFLMALLASVFYLTSRLVLPNRWSVLVALSGVLGTQVWSTASRGLWSHTWGILLLGFVVLMLVAHEKGARTLNPLLAATLLSWTYIVRPTNSVHILAITVYILIFYRGLFIRYAITGAAWLAVFVAYSWHHFGQVLPNYYRASRLSFASFGSAFAGHLISPSRGLFVFVPILFLVAYLLARYWSKLSSHRLAVLALTIEVGQLVVISGFRLWWGGHSFGPRYTTDSVPWLVLLGILGIRAMLDSRERAESEGGSFGGRMELAVAAALLFLSVLINGRGALSPATWKWNWAPVTVNSARVWDWRQPQFLAGLLPQPPP